MLIEGPPGLPGPAVSYLHFCFSLPASVIIFNRCSSEFYEQQMVHTNILSSTTVFNIENILLIIIIKVSLTPNQHILIFYEGSCDTEV